jgi:GNAT superfamily N-acetyltransferase
MTAWYSTADRALAQRIELGHAHSGLAFAQAAEPAVEEIAGGWAVFQGIDLPSTQALAVGMRGPVTKEEMDRLEDFFHSRGSAAIIDLCTLADPSVLEMTQDRGYVVREISNVLARPLELNLKLEDGTANQQSEISMEEAEPQGIREWARIVIAGFSETEEVAEDQVATLTTPSASARALFSLYQGKRVGAAGMDLHNGVATFFGDATLKQWRGRGLQLASIRHRLRQAAVAGCDAASASTLPGSTSHRNYERAGFQLLYVRTMLGRAVGR